MKQTILDACCGSRMFWFNKNHPDAIFMDIRENEFVACDGRHIKIKPDIIGDFRKMPFKDKSFKLVIFDPPHLNSAGQNSYMAQKYGRLTENWQKDIKEGFSECLRVLEPCGILIFKWNECQIPVSKISSLCDITPLFGHKSGKASKTHWLCFMKPTED
jgi:SAM-dependent methyltransferase